MADRNSGLNRPLTQWASRESGKLTIMMMEFWRAWWPPIDFHVFPIWFQVNTLVFLPLVAGNRRSFVAPGRLDVDYLATLSLCQILDSHGMLLGH